MNVEAFDGDPRFTTEPPPKSNGSGGAHKKKAERRYTLFTVDDLAAQPYAPDRVKNVLPRDGNAAVYGAWGSAKSFTVLHLAFALSDGLDFFGHKVEPCDVLYISLEGSGGLTKRVKAYRKKYGESAGARIRFITAPFALLSGDTDTLIATILEAGIGGGVVIIDTLAAATPGMQENDAEGMGRAISAASLIREKVGGLVILVHHSGKDPSKGMRGNSNLPGALDAIIETSRDGNSRSWSLYKARDEKDGIKHDFSLEVVELGSDEDGEPITSCVVVPHDQQPGSRKPVKLSGGAKLAMQALQEILPEVGEVMPGTSTIPAGVRAVKIDQWRERFYLRHGSEGDTSRGNDALRKAFLRARGDLLKAEAVGISDPWCWQWTS